MITIAAGVRTLTTLDIQAFAQAQVQQLTLRADVLHTRALAMPGLAKADVLASLLSQMCDELATVQALAYLALKHNDLVVFNDLCKLKDETQARLTQQALDARLMSIPRFEARQQHQAQRPIDPIPVGEAQDSDFSEFDALGVTPAAAA